MRKRVCNGTDYLFNSIIFVGRTGGNCTINFSMVIIAFSFQAVFNQTEEFVVSTDEQNSEVDFKFRPVFVTFFQHCQQKPECAYL